MRAPTVQNEVKATWRGMRQLERQQVQVTTTHSQSWTELLVILREEVVRPSLPELVGRQEKATALPERQAEMSGKARHHLRFCKAPIERLLADAAAAGDERGESVFRL